MTERDRDQTDTPGRVLVVGSINMDLVITCSHHPRVGETIIATAMERHPGGKGSNQAVAAARAGAATEFVGAIGGDNTGRELRNFLQTEDVGVSHMRQISEDDSGLAIVVVAAEDNSVVVVSGANAQLGPGDLAGVPVGPQDILASQFEISEPTIRAFFERGRAVGARTVLNPSPTRPFSPRLWELSNIVLVNEIELEGLVHARGGIAGTPGELLNGARSLIADDQAIIVTRGSAGCVVVTPSETISIPGHRVEVVDTTGAGDCFLGFLAARLLHRDGLVEAARLANAAASLCVQRLGAGNSMPSAAEVVAADVN